MLQQMLLHSPPPRRRKLLVLDANGLLFWRVRKGQAPRGSPNCLSKLPQPDASVNQFAIFARPHVRDFVRWCTEHFVVVVWSTAQRKNLEPMVKLAFDGLPPPALVLDQADCTPTGESDGERPLMLKELSKLWGHPQLLAACGSYGATDTVLVDDSPYKTANNPEHTAIHRRRRRQVQQHAGTGGAGAQDEPCPSTTNPTGNGVHLTVHLPVSPLAKVFI